MANCEWQCPAGQCYFFLNLVQVLADLKKNEYHTPQWFINVRAQIELAKKNSCHHPMLAILIPQSEAALSTTEYLHMLDNL